jgi:cellulose synthase/poly-beta-1,6-N-acetylglucosamine synthase-like glycosyltransferase
MRITVLIPTYHRTTDLKRCLEALQRQTQAPAEVLLVVRDTDTKTWEFIQQFLAGELIIQTVIVTVPGQVAALNAGLDAAQGDIIAITDDDAAPHLDWLERIQAHFIADDQVGGVGGRDWVYHGTQRVEGARLQVGKIQWFGRTINNHHLGAGPARTVDILKGANMSYRRTAISGLYFDLRLKGCGAQVHNDLGFSLTVRKRGWKLIYDPTVAVDHFPAERFDEDQRTQFNALAWSNMAHNETVALLTYLSPLQRVIYLVWATLIGTRGSFGLIQVIRFLPMERALAVQKWFATLQGRWQGIQACTPSIFLE